MSTFPRTVTDPSICLPFCFGSGVAFPLAPFERYANVKSAPAGMRLSARKAFHSR